MLSFYHFQRIENPLQSRDALFESINTIPGLRGTIYLSEEGINGQMAVPPGEPLEALLSACSSFGSLPFDPFTDNNPPNLGDVVSVDTPTFHRLVVRVRDYILRDGISDDIIAPLSLDWSDAGPELSPSEWHEQIVQNENKDNENGEEDDTMILIDCRNLYESQEGTFEGAIPL
ncbi:MAG: hypothetical protein SGARI_003928, partial [Bacillariaceae sp.]